MSEIINVEEQRKKVDEIEAKKMAIREAADLGIETLESNKPKIKTYSINDTKFIPIYDYKGGFDGFTVFHNGHQVRIEYPNSFGYYNMCAEKQSLQGVAACIIKIFGPIPQELIDSVVVK